MANINDSLTTLQLPTGIVLIVFGATDRVAGGVIERADDNGSGSAGTFSPIGTLNVIDPSGTPYVDPLPMDGVVRYYRAKHVRTGFLDSDYTDTASGRPDVIDPNIDFASKPWLYNGAIPLQLVMDVISETTGSLTVSSSLNRDPAGLGSPTVSVYSYYGVGVPLPVGGGTWQITKPASGIGRVTFTNTLAGRQSGLDAIDIQAAQVSSTSSFLSLIVSEVSSSATGVLISSSVVNPSSYPTNVSVYSSQSVTPVLASPGVWSVTRPATGVGSITFHVTSSTAGVIDDFDSINIDSQNREPLSVIGTVTNIYPNGLSGSFAIRDPFQVSGTLQSIAFTLSSQSLAGFTASLGSLTNTGGVLTYPFFATYPLFGAGDGQVIGTATKTGMVADADSVNVPQRTFGVAHLTAKLTPTVLGTSTVTLSASYRDPTDPSGSEAPPTIAFALLPSGSFTGTNPYVVNRPLSGSIEAVVTVTKIGRVEDTAEVTVTANTHAITSADYLGLIMTPTVADANYVYYSASVINPAGYATNVRVVNSINDAGITSTGLNTWQILRPTDLVASYIFQVTSSAAGVVSDEDIVIVSSTNQAILSVVAQPPTSVTDTTITLDVEVRDPLQSTGTLSGITMTTTDTGNSGLSVTLNSTTTHYGYTTYNYTINRPNAGAGGGRVVFTATKSGYTQDADSVDVVEQFLYPLGIGITTLSGSMHYMTVEVTGSDALGGSSPTIALRNDSGLYTNQVSATATTGKEVEVWTIGRPLPDEHPASITFTVNKSGRQSISGNYEIAPQPATGSSGGGGGGIDYGTNPAIPAFFMNDSGQLEWTVVNVPSGATYTLTWTTDLTDGTHRSEFDDGVSTPYAFTSYYTPVSKGTPAWQYMDIAFVLRMNDSGNMTVATATYTLGWYTDGTV